MNKHWQELLAWLSGLGFVVGLVWNLSLRAGVLEFAGTAGPRPVFFVLFLGVFAVFMLTVFTMQRFDRGVGGFDFTFGLRTWKLMLKGAPEWSWWVVGASFVYAFINFFSPVNHRCDRVEQQRSGVGNSTSIGSANADTIWRQPTASAHSAERQPGMRKT